MSRPKTHLERLQARDGYFSPESIVRRLGSSPVTPFLGTPATALPQSYREFRAYFDSQLRGGTITVTQPAREVADVILAAPLPAPLRLLAPAHRLATARILPPELRHQYGLRWTSLHNFALPLAGASVRYTTIPILNIVQRVHTPLPRFAG
jgi:uncharacterized protein (DUF2236 family)